MLSTSKDRAVSKPSTPWKPALFQEERLIRLLYHRNKNQHAVATWWRQFNKFKRLVSQCVVCIRTRQYIVLYRLILKFQRVQLKQMYYQFNGVIELGQFVTLGVVLVGHLARINSLFKQIVDTYDKIFRRFKRKGKRNSNRVKTKKFENSNDDLIRTKSESNGEDIGEALDEVSIPGTIRNIPSESVDLSGDLKVEKTEAKSSSILKEKERSKSKCKSKAKAKSRSKSKSKSAIDDIFGI